MSRTLQPALLLTLCVFGSRLDADVEIRAMAASLTTKAKAAMQLEIGNICLSTIQACILLANIFAAELEPAMETLYFGIATRMAQILKFHKACDGIHDVEREVEIRVWYSLVTADTFCSNNIGLPRQINAQDSNVELPHDEETFHRLPPGSSSSRLQQSGPGLWAQMIKLVEVYGSVHDLNRKLVDQDMPDNEVEQCVRGLAERLDSWKLSLPGHFVESDRNLDLHRDRGTAGPFVALHLGYHHYSTLLYFRYLDTVGARIPGNEGYADRCRGHASHFSRLLAKSRERAGSEAW
jgi:hypothetical protein